MDATEQADNGKENDHVMKMKEFDPSEMEKRLSFLNIDFVKYAVEKNKESAAIYQQLGKGYNFEMRSESKRLKSFLSFDKLSSWCPKAMAGAGFYSTGTEGSVQCFCCGLVFCTRSLRTSPYEDHLKYNPTCGFLQGKDVGNIPQYEVRVQLSEKDHGELIHEYTAEETRLSSFTDWPFYARIKPSELAQAGFFFTGRKDIVQCFSCLGCLGNWEQNDDPWLEHAKWFPECHFLQIMKTPDEIKRYIECYSEFSGFEGQHFTAFIGDINYPEVTRCASLNILEDERVRLETFQRWPQDAHIKPAALVKCGFYYIGVSDAVKCFTCGIQLHLFKPDDDPYSRHQEQSPTCEFLNKLTNRQPTQTHNECHGHDVAVQLNSASEQKYSTKNTGTNRCLPKISLNGIKSSSMNNTLINSAAPKSLQETERYWG